MCEDMGETYCRIARGRADCLRRSPRGQAGQGAVDGGPARLRRASGRFADETRREYRLQALPELRPTAKGFDLVPQCNFPGHVHPRCHPIDPHRLAPQRTPARIEFPPGQSLHTAGPHASRLHDAAVPAHVSAHDLQPDAPSAYRRSSKTSIPRVL